MNSGHQKIVESIEKCINNNICKILLEKDDAKKKGWVWDDNRWRRVISYTFLKETSKQNPNKYTDKCKVTLQEVENDNSSSIFKTVYDYNGDYFNSYKIYKKQN